ncbi:MAG: hypothetical protein ABII00_14805 [Elusimicrobiota bacterium]
MDAKGEICVRKTMVLLSCIIAAVGILTLNAYVDLILKAIFKADVEWAAAWSARAWFISQIIIFLPIMTVPVSALWAYRRTGSRGAGWQVVIRGFLRYTPVLAGDLLQLFAMRSKHSLFSPGVFGILTIIYAGWLIRKDRAAAGGHANP